MSETWQVILREFFRGVWNAAGPILAAGVGTRLAFYTLHVIDEANALKESPEKNSSTHDLSYIWNSKN